MKTYRVTIQQEFGWAITRVQASDEIMAVALAAVRLYDKEDGKIVGAAWEEID